MIDSLLLDGLLSAPDITGAVADGASDLALSAGAHIAMSLASGLIGSLGAAPEGIAPGAQGTAVSLVCGLAEAAGESFARGFVKGGAAELADVGSALAGAFFKSA